MPETRDERSLQQANAGDKRTSEHFNKQTPETRDERLLRQANAGDKRREDRILIRRIVIQEVA
jgi:hypothetical protein